MSTISATFTATGTSASLYLVEGQTASYTTENTFNAVLLLERTLNGGQTWDITRTVTDTDVEGVILDPGTYRWRCSVFTSGTADVTISDRIDPQVLPIIRNYAGEVVLNVTSEGVVTKTMQIADDVSFLTGEGDPDDGDTGTGAGFSGPGSLYFDITGGAAWINGGTKAEPTWTVVEAGTGSVTSVTANGGLSSSGGSTPNISVTDTNLIELRDTGDISGNAATATLATTATTATTSTTSTNFSGNLAGDVTGPQGTTAVALVGGQSAADVAAGAVLANASTASNTVSTIVRRDAAGRAQFVDPSAAQDAATKAYVDAVATGLTVHTPVVNASTADLTLSGEQTIDGVLTSTSRILVKNQAAPAENGIYVTAAGAWARATDMDNWAEVPGSFVFVQSGTVNGSSGYANTNVAGGTIDVTAMTWAQFSQAGSYSAGTGLDLTGSTFSVLYGTASGTATQGNDTRVTGAAQKASNLSDLANVATAVDNLGGASSTGTGGLARATSPVFTTPNIGVATGSVSGNAGSATVLATGRNINGVSFNGSANITVTAAGSTLSDAVPLTGLATQAAHTFVANASGSTAAPTAISLTSAAAELADWNGNVFKNFICDIVADTSTALTTSASQRGRVLTMSNASAITLTLDAQAEVGYSVTVYQKGAGQITFAAESGATIRNRQTQTKTAGQYAVCSLFVEANSGGSAAVWVLAGDTGA